MSAVIAQRDRSMTLTDAEFSALLSGASCGLESLLAHERRRGNPDDEIVDALLSARSAVHHIQLWEGRADA
jgi:hypothetical protein